MKGIVYILRDINDRFYIGSTNNIEKRLSQHLNGHTHTTYRMNEPRLVFSQDFSTLEEARKIELKLKKLQRKDYIEKIIKEGYIKIKPE